jgi:ribonuclease J
MNFNLKNHHKDLLFLPLGGANEIGMNLNLYHLNGKWLMIDCGIGFAYDVPGVSMMTPDISFLQQIKKNLLALIITHIHEDHLGAVVHLWPEIQAPIYASNFAINFLQSKLSETKFAKSVPLHKIQSKTLKLHPFELEFIGLTHSVPEMQAVLIKTEAGNILHTGDWKLDPDPVVGKPSDLETIKAYGDSNQILAMVCDSTNAINAGHSRSEGELYMSLKSLMLNRQGLIGVTTFASNLARIHTIAKIATEIGRKVILAGFSLHRLYEVGKKSGYDFENCHFISERELKLYNKNEVLVICTGCQGESMAAARKIATNSHPVIHFSKGDLMIFSSKIIPGNEKKIFELFDLLAKKQIDVLTEKDHFVHVSGHPSQTELQIMYDLAKPKIAIPVHGEFIHTKTHCELAIECGVQKAIQTENGLVIKIDAQNPTASSEVGFVKSGYLGVDGKQLLDLNCEVIKERKKLQDSGAVFVSLYLDKQLVRQKQSKIVCVGSYNLKEDKLAYDLIYKELDSLLKGKAKETKLDDKSFSFNFLKKKKACDYSKIALELEKASKNKLAKIFNDLMGKKPVIEMNIIIEK